MLQIPAAATVAIDQDTGLRNVELRYPLILLKVKGSLRRHVEFWQSMGAPKFILSVFSEGYHSVAIRASNARECLYKQQVSLKPLIICSRISFGALTLG